MKDLKSKLLEYGQYHQHQSNRITHYIGIPSIIMATLIFLSWASVSIAGFWNISFSWLAVAALCIYYFTLDIKLAAAATVLLAIMTVIATWIAYPAPTIVSFIIFCILFVGGWILQFLGHHFEKNRPAFFKNVMQMLIAPLYILVELIKALKLEKYFDLE